MQVRFPAEDATNVREIHIPHSHIYQNDVILQKDWLKNETQIFYGEGALPKKIL